MTAEVTALPVGALQDGSRATDAGNADRLVAATEGTIRFVHAWGRWIVYRDGRWVIDFGDALVSDTARIVARRVFDMIPSIRDSGERDRAFKWAKRSESAAAISAMVKLARGIPSVLTDHNDLDNDPWILNCVNGTIELQTGRLRAHDPDDLCTMQAPVMFDPDAGAPLFEAVLERALPDETVRSFVQRWAGSAITGIPVQALLLAVGSGANSKSVIMEALQRTLGDGYSVVPHKSLLVAGRHEQHPTHLASLKGARLVVAPETEAGDRLNEEVIKTLTGGDRLRARRMREDEWSFLPTWSAAMHTNHSPRIRGTDEGIWRRLHQVPFSVTIPEKERDETLTERLAASELPGVLNWMIAGCVDWLDHQRRLDPPPAITKATAKYRETQDHLGRFIAAKCVVAAARSITSRDLRQAYESWCQEEGEKPWTAKAVGAELSRRGCDSVKMGKGNVRTWIGLDLDTNPPDPEPLPIPYE